jgi:hypothetical protein
VALSTYAELKAAVASWLMRDDLAANVPDFITLAEARINDRVRVREMEASATLAPDANNVCTLPTDYIEARRVAADVDPVSILTPISLEMARDSFGWAGGYPYHYTIQGSSLKAWPTSSATVTLDYFAKIPALSDSNTTNWLLTKSPQIYLYASLLDSAPFLEDDPRLATWISLFKAAVDELLQADTRAKWSKGVARIRGVTP